jgi:outer membrane protein OmpA-like peptidoglycan-associated protein
MQIQKIVFIHYIQEKVKMKFGSLKPSISKIFSIHSLILSMLIITAFTSAEYCYAGVYWVNKVLECSSYNNDRSFNPNSFSPNQLIGKPNVMFDYGETPCAWSPQNLKRNDYFSVTFENRINVEQIAVFENFNPGAIVKITLYGEGKDTLVYSNSDPKPIGRKGRVFNIYCEKTSFKVERMRVDINTYKYTDNYQIDAIAISDSKEPIEAKINLSDDVIEMNNPENLGKNINSPYSELAPVIAPDGKTIYFTRERHPENIGVQNIWYAEIDKNGNFQQAKLIGSPLNTRYNNFAISILPDGNSMLVGNVYRRDGGAESGFSMTYKKGNEWSFPEAVKVRNFFSSGGKGSYCLASSGKVLLSSIQRNGGYGGNDIYVSFLQDDGIWSEPRNLGPDINTVDREDSPFLSADGVTMYFSSSGHPGYGSSDIFMSKRLDETWQRWSEPVNLGPKINTPEWDAYFTITASGDYAYFVSSQNTIGNEDIFRVKLPQQLRPEKVILVSGKVIDKKTKKPVAATIHYEKLSNGENIGIARSNPADGEYKIALPANEKYGFRAEAKDYIAVNENLDLTNIKKNIEEINRDLFLVPIEQGQALIINNVFFESGEFELLPSSFSELARLAKQMKESPTMKIKLEGHTDNIGNAQANSTLSNDRVNSVKKYLVEKGIEESRIQTKGFGATKPIAPNNTEEGRAKNRRVECTILAK